MATKIYKNDAIWKNDFNQHELLTNGHNNAWYGFKLNQAQMSNFNLHQECKKNMLCLKKKIKPGSQTSSLKFTEPEQYSEPNHHSIQLFIPLVLTLKAWLLAQVCQDSSKGLWGLWKVCGHGSSWSHLHSSGSWDTCKNALLVFQNPLSSHSKQSFLCDRLFIQTHQRRFLKYYTSL